MFDTFNKYRNKNGYVQIDSLPNEIIYRVTYGSRKGKIWFDYNGDTSNM